jgi:hypothetical protein
MYQQIRSTGSHGRTMELGNHLKHWRETENVPEVSLAMPMLTRGDVQNSCIERHVIANLLGLICIVRCDFPRMACVFILPVHL